MVIVGQAVSKIEGLTSLPQLRELWIAECKLQVKWYARLLLYFFVWYNFATDDSSCALYVLTYFFSPQKIEGLQELKLIQKLYLYSNEISCIENLDHLTELEVLWLHGNKIKDITVRIGLIFWPHKCINAKF